MLLFPIQQAAPKELAHCDDTHVLYWQARLAVTAWEHNTLVAQRKPSSELLKVLNGFNTVAHQVGYVFFNFDHSTKIG